MSHPSKTAVEPEVRPWRNVGHRGSQTLNTGSKVGEEKQEEEKYAENFDESRTRPVFRVHFELRPSPLSTILTVGMTCYLGLKKTLRADGQDRG
jgi:hypothetical protein